jgi:uncharacterized protein
MTSPWRAGIETYVREQAKPVDKFSHQPRLYALAVRLAKASHLDLDDDVVHAAAWLHDLGVFVGHRPERIDELARWDHVAYALREIPGVLHHLGFPDDRVPPVLEAVRTHLPERTPTTTEGRVLRDADILEQLGAVGILRATSKVGRDTRFPRYEDVVDSLRSGRVKLPPLLELEASRVELIPRLEVLDAFLASADRELGQSA